jgi:hypothetical protein
VHCAGTERVMAAELKIHRGCTIDHIRSQCMGKPAP